MSNDNSNSPTILVMAGGTGGHIFPGIAVADELKSRGWNVHWLGTATRMEAQLVPQHGYDISFVNIAGVRNQAICICMYGDIFKSCEECKCVDLTKLN